MVCSKSSEINHDRHHIFLAVLSCMQDVLFTPQKGRSAPNSLEEARAEQGQASQTATLKAAAAAMVPKRVCALLHTTYIHPAAAQMLVLYSIAECKSPALLKLL